MVKCTTEENKVPYFNAPVYLENKEQIGKVDEIFGQIREFVSFPLSLFQSVEKPVVYKVNFNLCGTNVVVAQSPVDSLTHLCSIFQSNFLIT